MPKDQEPILELVKLSKQFRSYWTYRAIKAIEDISLKVYPGEAFGFLGHNGAGKTTTLKCITGLIIPNAGEIVFCGKLLSESRARAKLGYLPEQPYFYDHLSVSETLEFFAALHDFSGKDRKRAVDSALEQVALSDRRKDRVRSLSKGLQQRLGIAQAIINSPKLLLLDEPFSGLDPLGRTEIRALLRRLQEGGTTIFMSSHILSDIEDICNRVAFLADGRLEKVLDLSEDNEFTKESYELVTADSVGKRKTISYENYELAQKSLSAALAEGTQVVSFKRVVPSLTEVFIRITDQARHHKHDSGIEHEPESRADIAQ